MHNGTWYDGITFSILVDPRVWNLNTLFFLFVRLNSVHTATKSQLRFPEKKLCGLSPNFHIHVSVSDLYIPRISPLIFLQQHRQADGGKI